MKKMISLILAIMMLCAVLTGGGGSSDGFTVGVCQLMKHDALDAATKGFEDALNEAMQAAGKTVTIDVQVAGDQNYCTTVINTFTAK